MNNNIKLEKKTIFRKAHNKENPYALISKSILRNKTLSAKAMGIMCYLLGLPDNWEINISQLSTNFADGEKSIKSGIRELISHGYIERYQERTIEGYFSITVMLVHEEPIKDVKTPGNSPLAQNRPAGKRLADKRTLINNIYNNNINTNNTDLKEVCKKKKFFNLSQTKKVLKKLKEISISKSLRRKWFNKYNDSYILEKLELLSHNCIKNNVAFLTKALREDWKSCSTKTTVSNSLEKVKTYPTHTDNINWFTELTKEEKNRYEKLATYYQYSFADQLAYQGTSVLDANFPNHNLFKMFMSLIGRAK